MRSDLLILFALLCGLLAPQARAQGPPADPELQGVGELLQKGRFDDAVAVIERVLERDPDEGWAWYQLGLAHHYAGRLDQALTGHRGALALAQPVGRLRAGASYNVACVHALKGRGEHALQWLHRARNAGWKDAAAARQDTDLAALREDERFEALLTHPAIADLDGTRVSTAQPEMEGGTGGVTLDRDGTLLVADFGAHVWRILEGSPPTLFAEGFVKAAGSTLDLDGHLIQVDFEDRSVWRLVQEGDEVKREDLGVEGLLGPVGVVAANDGGFFLTDFRASTVVQVLGDGGQRVLARGGLLKGPNGITRTPDGDLWVVNFSDGGVVRLHAPASADGEWRTSFVAELPGGNNGHIVARDGVLYVTARLGNAVYRVTPEGRVTRVAGDGSRGLLDGPGPAARLAYPNGIAVSSDGRTLYTNDQVTGGRFAVRRIELPNPKAPR